MKKLFIILMLILSTPAFAEDNIQIPDWYKGNERLYENFISACKTANRYCKSEIDCLHIENVENFYKYTVIVNKCIASQRPPLKKIEYIENKKPSQTVGVASIRG
ncbi:MAG: hypothetical protein IKP65_02375 [Alphaproteobacteria bacterium]|nr:hypothetical protein [Alphaproteobacteria bacterium]